jgi:hypothetical protein
MEKCRILCSTYGKMSTYALGVLLAGFVGGMVLSLLGLLISLAFPLKIELDPITITYVLGYLIGIPFGAYWLSKLVFKRHTKIWMVMLASLLGFLVTIGYMLWSGSEIIIIFFFFLFHLCPWLFASLVNIAFLPKIKVQTPETTE